MLRQIISFSLILLLVTLISCDDNIPIVKQNKLHEFSESQFFSEDGKKIGGINIAIENPGIAPYLRIYLAKFLSASKPIKSKYHNDLKYRKDSILWTTNEFFGWINKTVKPDGTKYSLLDDELKIHLSLNSIMQMHAESSVQEHLGQELQKELNKELSRFTDGKSPTANSLYIDSLILKTERYKKMAAKGVNPAAIKETFDTPIEMQVFSWNSKTNFIDTVMSPKDSIRYTDKFLQSGLISLNPKTGYIKAWVGGANYRFFQKDNIKDRKGKIGSLVYPFIYGTAIQDGVIESSTSYPNTTYCLDVHQTNWCVNSPSGTNGELISVKAALAISSPNIPLAVARDSYGIKRSIEFINTFGIDSEPFQSEPSILTGNIGVTLQEITSAYCAFANMGMHNTPKFITRIEDNEGNILTKTKPQIIKEVMNKESAYTVLNMLEGVIDGVEVGNSVKGTGMRLRLPKYGGLKMQIAGKTGTTQNKVDGWYIGLTPDLVTGIWVGSSTKNTSFKTLRLGQGANTALPIWGIYMTKIYADKSLNFSVKEFNNPKNEYSDLEPVEELKGLQDFMALKIAELPNYKVIDGMLKSCGLYHICEEKDIDQLDKDFMFLKSAQNSFEDYKKIELKNKTSEKYSDAFPLSGLKTFWLLSRDEHRKVN